MRRARRSFRYVTHVQPASGGFATGPNRVPRARRAAAEPKRRRTSATRFASSIPSRRVSKRSDDTGRCRQWVDQADVAVGDRTSGVVEEIVSR